MTTARPTTRGVDPVAALYGAGVAALSGCFGLVGHLSAGGSAVGGAGTARVDPATGLAVLVACALLGGITAALARRVPAVLALVGGVAAGQVTVHVLLSAAHGGGAGSGGAGGACHGFGAASGALPGLGADPRMVLAHAGASTCALVALWLVGRTLDWLGARRLVAAPAPAAVTPYRGAVVRPVSACAAVDGVLRSRGFLRGPPLAV